MFVGHFALAMAAKRVAPRTSLGTLVLAAQFLDLLWPLFLLAGVERVEIRHDDTAFTPLLFAHYPYSHSLVAALAWAAVVAGVYAWRRRYARGVAVIAALVVSHWVLDWVTHRPDLPLYPGGPLLGLGLWNSVPGTLIVELLLFAAGLRIYLAATRARGAAGRWNPWAFAAVLLALYLAAAFGPLPPGETAVAVSALGMGLLVAWAAWVDSGREAVAA
jgi:LexA-binding, inner membrane-associated putative hydrolase